MNKLKETMDRIELGEYEKAKMLRHILNHEKEKKRKYKTKFIPRFAVFFLTFILVSSSCYALVKVFHVDDKFKFLFDKTEEELNEYGVSGSEVAKTKEFDKATITIEQTILDEKELYIMLLVKGKQEEIYLDESYLSSGSTFDEAILKKEKDLEGNDTVELVCNENQMYGCYSYGMSLVSEEEKNKGYVLTFSIDGTLNQTNEVTLRLIAKDGTNYDIPFTLNKNDMKEKEINDIRIVYEEENLTASVSAIRITPLHIIVDFNYSKPIQNLTNSEKEKLFKYVYNEEGNNNSYITYKDGKKTILRLEGNTLETMVGSNGDKENQIHDIEQVKSVTINRVTFAF